MFRLLFSLLLLVVFFDMPLAAQTDYISKLKNQEQFLKLEGKPLSEKYSGTKAVKVVLDLRNHKLFFISSKAYRYHRDFCMKVLGNNDELSQFNYRNYKSSYSREYVFATINFYPEKNIYTLEFSDIEKFSKDVLLIYKLVQDRSFIGEGLKLHPITGNQTQFLEKQKERYNIITSNELYNGISRQMLVRGNVIGRLRRIHIDTLADTKINPWDIVLTNGSPNDIDLCAGLILTQFQSPLSHINILCHNRGTPVLAYKNAYDNNEFLAFVNQVVRLEIADDYKIGLAKKEELQRIISNKGYKAQVFLKVDKTFDELINLEKLSHRKIDQVGGKAANLGELYRVPLLRSTCRLPQKGFAIPLIYYLNHFKASGADLLLNSLLIDSVTLGDKVLLKAALKKIRKTIRAHLVDEDLLKKVNDKLTKRGYKVSEKVRFRSSTNAEDIKGFNGAGLYASTSAIFGSVEGKTIERAIKKVWASVWKEAAFRERAYFNMKQETVAMGIAVHQAFGREDVNGVAVTKNLYRKNDEAFVINAQKGEVAIVAAKDTATAELAILSKSFHDQIVQNDYISYSSLNNGEALMTQRQLEKLYESLERIKQHYYFRVRKGDTPYADYALDLEFKIKEGRLLIKQVRPFE